MCVVVFQLENQYEINTFAGNAVLVTYTLTENADTRRPKATDNNS